MASWQKLDLFLLSFYNGYPLVFEDLCTNIWWRNFIQSYIVFHITEHVYFSPFQVVSWSHMGWGQGPIPLRPRAQSRHHFWPPAPTHLPKPKPPGRKKRPSGNFRGLPAFSCPHHPPAYEGKIRTSNIVRTKKSLVRTLVQLLAASTLSCWMSPLARIALPQTTWPPRVPPECPCWRRA